jgi:hypothetical protein
MIDWKLVVFASSIAISDGCRQKNLMFEDSKKRRAMYLFKIILS